MSDNQPSDSWPGYPPASDGTWAPQPGQPTPPQPGAPYEPGGGYAPPADPYASPVQPADPYQPAGGYQPAAPYQPAGGYQPTAPYQATSPFSGAQGQQPGYPSNPAAPPWATPPPQGRRKGPMIIIAVVVVVLLVCVGGIVAVALSGSKSKTNTTSTGSTNGTTKGGTTPTPKAPVIALGDGTALKAHLVSIPSGAKKQKVDGSTNGVESLDQFIKISFDGDSTEKSLMEGRNFKVAAEEWWEGSKGDQVHVQVIQFGDTDGADSYVRGQHGAYADDSEVKSTFKLSGVDTSYGYGYERPALDDNGFRSTVLMAESGNYAIVVFDFTPGQFSRTTEESLVQRQVTALTS